MLKAWVLVILLGAGRVVDSYNSKFECERFKIEHVKKNPGYKLECLKVSHE
jgi:hypothetical protein